VGVCIQHNTLQGVYMKQCRSSWFRIRNIKNSYVSAS